MEKEVENEPGDVTEEEPTEEPENDDSPSNEIDDEFEAITADGSRSSHVQFKTGLQVSMDEEHLGEFIDEEMSERRPRKSALKSSSAEKDISTSSESFESLQDISFKEEARVPVDEELLMKMTFREEERIRIAKRLEALRESLTGHFDSPWERLRQDIKHRRESNIRQSLPNWRKYIYRENLGESSSSVESLPKIERRKVPTGERVWAAIKPEVKEISQRPQMFRELEGIEEETMYSEPSEECVCELGEPKFMYKKGHETPCKVKYPTSDPCVFTDAPAFRGRMLFSQPCDKPLPPKKKKVPQFSGKYDMARHPHDRQILLLEDLRRAEALQKRIHFLNPCEKEAQNKALREAIGALGPRHIRQYRTPFHESIFLDLDEDGLHDTAAFLRKLYKLEGSLNQPDEITYRWESLLLIDYPKVAKTIASKLIAAEKFAKNSPAQMDKCIDSKLEAALYLMDISEGFYWAAEQLLLSAIETATTYKRDCSRREASVRYIYGHLLAEKVGNFSLAMEHLEIARNLSLTKIWTIEVKEIPITFDNLNLQATYMLCRVMVQHAKEIRPTDCVTSLKILSRALRYLGEDELVEIQASVLLELGVSYEMIGEFRMAHVVMQRYLEIPNRSLEPPGKCSAYLEMAFCHRLLGENETAEAYLQETLRTAKAAQSRELNAVANKYVGIGYLAMGYFKKASKHFQTSFQGFMDLGLTNDMDYVRVVGGISKGAEILPYLVELIKETEDTENETALEDLIRWRMRHTKFWDDGPLYPQLYDPEYYNILRTENLLEDEDAEVDEEEQREKEDMKRSLKSLLSSYKSGRFLLPDAHPEGSTYYKERLKWRAITDAAPPVK